MSRPRYDWACPTCGASKGEHCRSLTSRRVTDTHKARLVWLGIFSNDAWEDVS